MVIWQKVDAFPSKVIEHQNKVRAVKFYWEYYYETVNILSR